MGLDVNLTVEFNGKSLGSEYPQGWVELIKFEFLPRFWPVFDLLGMDENSKLRRRGLPVDGEPEIHMDGFNQSWCFADEFVFELDRLSDNMEVPKLWRCVSQTVSSYNQMFGNGCVRVLFSFD